MKYKYDFHCHIHEGSIDSNVYAKEYIESLINKGFTGFLVTDHNTYKGYEYIKKNLEYDNFYVLKGIEVDTLDGGHTLVIMPNDYKSSEIERKTFKIKDLIKYVHKYNGVLGPAHPFSEPYLSLFNTKKNKNNYDILNEFDFIEVFNAGEKKEENEKALEMAEKYSLFKTAGSDAHELEDCGKGYVEIEEKVTCNNELIEYIKNHKPVVTNGEYYRNVGRERYDRIGKISYFIVFILLRLYRKL